MPVFRLDNTLAFPPPDLAEDGLLAVGGDLRVERLVAAYSQGIFPWYSAGEPILWWSPDPRMILTPQSLHVARRLERTLRQGVFEVTLDTAFPSVIEGCADIRRPRERGTWITRAMMRAYCALHEAGFAHSVECWQQGALVGGLYGVSLGGAFFGESMFSRVPDASKVALVRLVRQCEAWDMPLIDCQLANPHLHRLGAHEIPRLQFLELLDTALQQPTRHGKWSFSDGPSSGTAPG